MTVFQNSELWACAERETKMRRRIYPRWVEQEKMSPLEADLQIRMMEAIARHFFELAEMERLL